jgi:redox-sensitive bicupin YhaK (pirin superfamily)
MDRRDFGRLVAGSAATLALSRISGCTPPSPSTRSSAPPIRDRGLRQRTIAQVVPARSTREGAGFPVHRPFPTPTLALMDPFVLLDEFGPVDWAPGEAVGAPDHPHRGFETVTYMIEGVNQHADSLGNHGRLAPGDVQWMTAGSGIVHAELPADQIVRDGGRVHGFQLWVNLPARSKLVAPRYQEVPGRGIPLAASADGRARAHVIAGDALGVRAVIDTHTPIQYQHWTLEPGARIDHDVRADHNVSVFVFRGRAALGEEGRAVNEYELTVFGDGDRVRLAVPRDAERACEFMLMAGVPLREPVARWGPFVMNTDEEIRQAIADYRSGRMGRIPGSEG